MIRVPVYKGKQCLSSVYKGATKVYHLCMWLLEAFEREVLLDSRSP